jgi:hypothetical protein
MRYICKVVLILLPVFMLSLSGCGSSSSGNTADPFSNGSTNTGTGGTTPTTPVTAQDPVLSLDLNTDLKLPTDLTTLPQVDANIGTVLLTAKLLNITGGTFIDPNSGLKTEAGSPVPNQTVTFTILAGPGTISYTTPLTDKNGESKAILTTGNVTYTTNVIVEAATTIAGKNYRAYTSFQIVRGTGIITIGTNGTLDPMNATIDPNLASGEVFLQQIHFKLTDSNGNPRVGVPVTLSLYSQSGNSTVVIDYLKIPVTEPSQQTVTTASDGTGIFNVSVTMTAPPPGLIDTDSIVYKAVTNDANPIIAYVGGTYSLTSKLPTLVITPSAASFGTATDITFTISGGVPPYSVTSNNTSRVIATLQADGHTVLAHLVDTTAWTGSVTISATDFAGQTVSATVTR